nr:hypothetical protein [Granulicella cerasi]
MLVEGKAESVDLMEVQSIAFVRDFNLNDKSEPERLGRRQFQGRPRSPGLWVRLHLPGNDLLEGMTEFDVTMMNSLLEDGGLMLTPPDGRSNTLRLFLPRHRIVSIEVLGWITTTAKPSAPKRSVAEDQPVLFER